MTDNPNRPIDAWHEWIRGRSWPGTIRSIASITRCSRSASACACKGNATWSRKGPQVIVANHQSFLDPLVIGLCAQRPLVYLAQDATNPYFATLIRSLNAVPMDQEGVGKEGIRVVLEQLSRGRAVVVFPEGERTWDGKMLPPAAWHSIADKAHKGADRARRHR